MIETNTMTTATLAIRPTDKLTIWSIVREVFVGELAISVVVLLMAGVDNGGVTKRTPGLPLDKVLGKSFDKNEDVGFMVNEDVTIVSTVDGTSLDVNWPKRQLDRGALLIGYYHYTN